MKKLRLLVVALLLFSFVLPVVNAEEAVQETSSNEVNVYIFKGETCGFCAAALEYFQGLEAEHGGKFELVQYEVWYNADNAALMEDVAEYLGVNVSGVPFIIIGDENWNGFNEQLGKEMLDKILAEYSLSQDERTDVIKDFQSGKKPNESKDLVLFVAAIIGVGAMVAFVCFARRASEADLVEVETKPKKAKAVIVPEEDEEEVVVEKKKTSKKSNSKSEKTSKKSSTTTKKKSSSSTKNKK